MPEAPVLSERRRCSMSLRRTRLKRAFLLARDDSVLLQIIRHVSDATHELPVISCFLSTICWITPKLWSICG